MMTEKNIVIGFHAGILKIFAICVTEAGFLHDAKYYTIEGLSYGI